MIVLDEHLQSKGIETAIRQWHVGSVVNVLDAKRAGKAIRITTQGGATFYSNTDATVRLVGWF